MKVGDSVTKGQTLGRSGMIGPAAGDHLHFTMPVAGHPVNPVEWVYPHWIQDWTASWWSERQPRPASKRQRQMAAQRAAAR
ncbi:MAG: M23 family metallopeptidase [Vicinamibacterales bacterium]